MGQGNNITIDRIMPGETGAFEQWYSLLTEIFTDPADLEPKEDLLERLNQTNKNIFFIFRDEKGKPIGMELLQRDPAMPDAPVAYVPWAGMIPEHRNHGEYPQIAKQIMNAAKGLGVALLIHEVEDPKRIHVAYGEPADGSGENCKNAGRRTHLWRRPPLNTLLVNDGTFGDPKSKTAYVRPASDDDQNIQAYDIMALRELDPLHPMFGVAKSDDPMDGIYNEDKTAISFAAYKRIYLQMTQIQYEADMPEGLNAKDYYTLLEQKLRADYPAVEDFCSRVDEAMKTSPWMKLDTSAIVPRSGPTPVHNVQLGKNLANDNVADAPTARVPNTGKHNDLKM
ncbi:MAG TPA: hypothetical protein VIN59_00350 [Alphaproteobacteria bacterium]